jgi:hypothetical protein
LGFGAVSGHEEEGLREVEKERLDSPIWGIKYAFYPYLTGAKSYQIRSGQKVIEGSLKTSLKEPEVLGAGGFFRRSGAVGSL